MTIPLKQQSDADLELFASGDTLNIDVVEPRSSGHIIVGATLGVGDEVRLGVASREVRVMGDFAVDGNFDMTLGDILNIGEAEFNSQVWHPPVINNAATGTVNVDFRTGNVFRLGLTGNITSLTADLPNNGWVGTLRLEPNAAGRTIVWTVAVKWVNGVEPPMSVLLANESFLCHFVRETSELLGSFTGPYPA